MYKLYQKHLYSKYGYYYVVFDCCWSGPSQKIYNIQIEVAFKWLSEVISEISFTK